MKLAIASGKGGTGKTTLAVSLALAVAEEEDVWLLDCDVEEPNSHIFLPLWEFKSEPVMVRVPTIIEDKCDGCGSCANFCQFNALAVVKSSVMIFPELCHACGGCKLVCPRRAINENEREVGLVRWCSSGNLTFVEGCINVGEAMSTTAIRAVKRKGRKAPLSIRDCPPGTACPMVEAVRDADYVLLVTEPSPFGLHDLDLAIKTVQDMELPFGVVLNRADHIDRSINDYCTRKKIDLLMEIPDRRDIAEGYSEGRPLADTMPEFKLEALKLLKTARQKLTQPTCSDLTRENHTS